MCVTDNFGVPSPKLYLPDVVATNDHLTFALHFSPPFNTHIQLVVRTMPTVVIFSDGVAIDKILGFEELADSMPPGQEDSWPTIVLARLLAAKGGINSKVIVDDDEVEANMQVCRHFGD